jgi:hypothetical protein
MINGNSWVSCPSNIAAIPRLDSYEKRACLAAWCELSAVLRIAGWFDFRGWAGDSMDRRHNLAAHNPIHYG